MIKLILGGAGTGKSTRLREMICDDVLHGVSALLLVPEQETVAAERRMLDILPPSAQLSFEVTNFTRLANRVFRTCGGLTYRYIEAGAKQLAMWNTLRGLSPILSMYRGRESDETFSSLMLSAVEEFKAYSVSPAVLERAAEKAVKGSGTEKKLSDLALIYAAYENAISGYGDGSDDIAKLSGLLHENNIFSGCRIYIDSFTSFTAAELEVIMALAHQAESVTAALCLSEHSGLQFEVTEETLHRIERLSDKEGIKTEKELLTVNRRTSDSELLRLSRDLWSFDADTEDICGGSGAVELFSCTNVYEEAEAAAAKICGLVRGGMRYRDIAVIARDAGKYEGIIDEAFEKAGIPYFMSVKRDVTAMPFPKLLILALRIVGGGWRGEDVITYLKTGLCGLSERESDLLEEYIWRWSINGKAFVGGDWTMNPYSYSASLDERQTEVLGTVNGARRKLTEPLLALSEALYASVDNASLCRALFEYMKALSIADKMRAEAERAEEAGRRADASETLQLYNTVLDALSIIAEFDCGEEGFDIPEFETALKIVLSKASVGSIPTSCDEVTVGSASMLRADEPKCVIMIGVNDGVFPEAAGGDGIISDEDRHFLCELGIQLAEDSVGKSSEELFYVYRAVSAPSEKLILTYASSELQGGKERRPSLAFERVRLLTGEPVTDFSSLPFEKRLPGERAAFEYAALLGDNACGRALRRYFSEKKDYEEALQRLAVPICARECRVQPEITDLVFGERMSFSPSALEKYVKCHFDYYCEAVLRLRPDEKNLFRMTDTGTLIHELLEKFISRVTDENGFDAERAEEECDKLLEELIRIYAEENFPEKEAMRARTEYILHKLHGLSVLLARNITKEFSKSRFVPAFFELKIGVGDGETTAEGPVIALPDGSRVFFRGIVDRVDIMREDGNVYVKVVDYKTGRKEFSLDEVKEGLNVQMLLYLFALCESKKNRLLLGCEGDGQAVPAGVVYLSSKVERQKKAAGTTREEVLSDADAALVRSGLLLSDAHVIEAMNRDRDYRYILSGMKGKDSDSKYLKTGDEFNEIKSQLRSTLESILTDMRCGDACVSPRTKGGDTPCIYCRMRAVCRSGHIKTETETEGENENGMD